MQTPEIIVATWRAAKAHIIGLTEQQVREHLHCFDEIWSELFPAEQTRIVQLWWPGSATTPKGVGHHAAHRRSCWTFDAGPEGFPSERGSGMTT